MWISDTSIKRPVFATMIIMSFVVLGLVSMGRLGVDLEEPAQHGPGDLVVLARALRQDLQERRGREVDADEAAEEVQHLDDLAVAHHIFDLGGEPLTREAIDLAGRELEAIAEQRGHRGVALAIGLGARDSLRLEAGLCLYGHDLDETISPVEAGLTWAIQKSRRQGGVREGSFPGAARILRELADGPARRRVGLSPEGRAPMRDGTVLFDGEGAVGTVTSGGFGPSVEAPVAMAYVPSALSTPGTRLEGEVRGKRLPVTIVEMPFFSTSYKR